MDTVGTELNFAAARRTTLEGGLNMPAWVGELRDQAYDKFVQAGIPSTRSEEWKYTSLRRLSERTFNIAQPSAKVSLADVEAITMPGEIPFVFVNGVFSPDFSQTENLPYGLTLKSLADGCGENEAVMQQVLRRSDLRSESPLYYLNQSLLAQGVYLEVAKGVVIENPIHLVFINDTGAKNAELSSSIFPRNVLVVGESASVDVIETYYGKEGDQCFTNVGTNILLGENASIGHYKFQREAIEASHIGCTNVVLNKHSRLKSFVLSLGSRLCRNDLNVTINGEGAEVELNGLYLANGEQHVDNHTQVNHKVGLSNSSQLYKGIVAGHGRAVFNGKVLVQRNAQQTKAHQLNQNLIIGEDAEVDTKPELLIDADDVKCNHGAAIGQINAEELFYLQSRGITRQKAESILSRAFAAEVILKIPLPQVRDNVNNLISAHFS